MDARQLVRQLLANPSVQDKVLIERTYAPNGDTVTIAGAPVRLGDDCAAIPDGHGGYTLFAAEGLVEAFVANEPWFAGYSAVMVNISDICAMGGLPVALTNVIWSRDQPDSAALWDGMLAACAAYDVPMVGGHTCYNSAARHLAVSIIGKAERLLSSFDARPGDQLLMAIDMNGEYFKQYPFWNASTHQNPTDLRRKMHLFYTIANAGLSGAAKDISMGGIVGTLHMLARTSRVGAVLDIDAVPAPPGVPLEKWLTSFPSYGYLLTSPPTHSQQIINLFTENGIQATVIGEITASETIQLRYQGQTVPFVLDAMPEPV
ncbi:sll0787 family AIR synthase-like protein [Hymenobacter sp.]|jgi:hypothetical protein|uniref:sll0787 family AIR synthase-like protein n=1 Tax=Hymenobacter sp. TaxID=1898978 RepID=UPI002ED85E7A